LPHLHPRGGRGSRRLRPRQGTCWPGTAALRKEPAYFGLLACGQPLVVCAPPGWRASVACRALCCGGRAAVEGFPWPGRPRGWAPLGSRSPGLHLAAAVVLPPQEAQGNPCGATSRAGRTAPSPLHAMGPPLDIALLRRDWGRAGRRKHNQKLQRPAAYRPGERRARFSPPPLRRPWEAQPPLRVAAAHSPQTNSLEQACFFCFETPTPQGGNHEAHHRRFTHVQ
jgi:hypothetical protein